MDDNTLALLEKICDHVGLDVQELSSLCENQERNQLVTQSNDKIYKPWKKKNKWYIRVKRDGKMLYYSYDTELRAKRAYQQALEDANIEKLTVKQALGEYQAHQRRLNKKTSALTTTYRLYAWLESILHVPILAVTEQALIEIYKARAQCVAGATSRNELAQVKTFFKFCEKHKYVKQCPAAGITPDYSPRARRGKKALRPGEAAILVKSLLEEDTPAARALLLQIGTGLRSGELCALQVRDIDALTRTVWIDSSKSDSGKRQVRIPDPYWDTIYRQVQGRQPLEFAFAGHAGKPHWPDWLRKNLQRRCKKLGLPIVTAHSLRSTVRSIGHRDGLSLQDIARALGHHTTRVTQEHYTDADYIASADSAALAALLTSITNS